MREEKASCVTLFLWKKGWAKRWFQLSPSGVLSYSLSPNSVTRGSIQIMLATISSNPDQRLIHIDSGTMLYHLKTLSSEDHERWTAAFREYRSGVLENDLGQATNGDNEGVQVPDTNGTIVVGTSRAIAALETGLSGSAALAADIAKMGKNIDHLRTLLQRLALAAESRELYQQLSDLAAQLSKDHTQVRDTADEQYRQWRTVRDLLATDKAAGLENQDSADHYSFRKSVTSTRSSISEQFFDAEDIVLSGGDDDFFQGEEEGNEEDSSDDDEDGNTIRHFVTLIDYISYVT